MDENYTPIFEWCSRKNRIVVDYPEDRLVLLAIRHNIFGDYTPYDEMIELAYRAGIDYVKAIDMSFEEARKSLTSLEGAEGFIVRFDDGHMLKIKGEWYVQLHKTLEHIQHEKDLIRLILDERLDDAKPFLPSDLVAKLDDFGRTLFKNVDEYVDKLGWSVIEDFDRSKGSKKNFAEITKVKNEPGLRFKIFDFIDNKFIPPAEIVSFTRSLVLDKIKSNLTSSTKVEGVRHLFGGISWKP